MKSAFTLAVVTLAATQEQPRLHYRSSEKLQRSKEIMPQKFEEVEKALKILEKDATPAVTNPEVLSVTAKGPISLSNGANIHDFYSLSPFHWPDPLNAAGPYKYSPERKKNPEAAQIPDLRMFEMLLNETETLALAYYFFSDEKYAEKAINRLITWFMDEATYMTPKIQWGRYIKNSNKPMSDGIIDFASVYKLLDSVGILETSSLWIPQYDQKLKEWFRSYLQFLQTDPLGLNEKSKDTHHGTFYYVQVLSIALYLEDQTLAESFSAEIKAKIDKQLGPDGALRQEIGARSWVDSQFSLYGMTVLADLGNHINLDLWKYETPEGGSIKKGMDHLKTIALNNGQGWTSPNQNFTENPFLVDLLKNGFDVYKDQSYPEAVSVITGGNFWTWSRMRERLYNPVSLEGSVLGGAVELGMHVAFVVSLVVLFMM